MADVITLQLNRITKHARLLLGTDKEECKKIKLTTLFIIIIIIIN